MNSTVELNKEFSLLVNYAKTIEQAVNDGEYHIISEHISNKNFPISLDMIEKKIEVSAKLFYFSDGAVLKDAISKMDEENYGQATLMELLVLGSLHPDLQKKYPIMARGSYMNFQLLGRGVPYLNMKNDHRVLDLDMYACTRFDHFCLLGIRK